MSKKKNPNTIKPTKGDRVLNIFIIVVLAIIAVVVMYPLYLVILASISDPTYISQGKVWFLPKGINFEAYKKLLDEKIIWIGYRNSLFYTIFGTFLQMIVTTAASVALSKKDLPGRSWITLFFVFTMYFTGGMIPTYLVIKEFGMINTIWALLIPCIFGPYNLVISRNYFENSIPESVYESAALDGAGQFRTFVQIAVPLAKPVLAVMCLNFALGHWNSYLDATMYITDDKIQTLQVFIKRITLQAATNLDSSSGLDMETFIASVRQTQLLKYAIVVVSAVPMVLLYPFIQRYFVKGIMLGSVKG